jgi:hypothetical protein
MPVESVYVKLEPVEVTVRSTGEKVVVPSRRVRIVTVGKVGPSGPAGEQGDAGSPAIEIPFSFGDATPLVLATVSAGKIVERVTVYLYIAFDGVGPSLRIGDTEQLDRIMTTTEVNPAEVAVYQVSPGFAYDADTEILLSIDAGLGPSQGSGLVVIEIQQ